MPPPVLLPAVWMLPQPGAAAAGLLAAADRWPAQEAVY